MRQFLFTAIMIMLAIGSPAFAQSASNLPQTCNPAFYDTMSAKAWMGGNRDIEAAQTLITGGKTAPGNTGGYSVLQLSCFDQMSKQIGGKSNEYGNGLTSAPGNAYLANNFAAGLCADMQGLWNNNKCANLNKDDFTTLKDLVTKDPRGCTGGQAEWKTAYDLTSPSYDKPQSGDAEITYLDRLSSAQGCSRIQPIPTGLQILLADGDNSSKLYNDALCPAPGCAYNAKAGTCN